MSFSMWNILAIVMSIGMGFLFYYLAKLIIELHNVVKQLEGTLNQIQNNVSEVLTNVEGITENFEKITGRADSLVQNVQTKANDSMKVVDELKKAPEIIKHTLYVAVGYGYDNIKRIKKSSKFLSKESYSRYNTKISVSADTEKDDIQDHIEIM